MKRITALILTCLLSVGLLCGCGAQQPEPALPEIIIGSDTYQLAPSPTPSPEPTLAPDETPAPTGAATPRPTSGSGSYEYQVPSSLQNGATNNSYGFTLAPTATPTPTAPPLDLSVEED